MRILWAGPIVDRNLSSISSAISPAANNWQLDFIKGLKTIGELVSIFSYIPYSAWPKGNLFSKPIKSSLSEIHFLTYPNIHLLRNYFIAYKYIKLINKHSKIGKTYDVLITYNASKQNLILGKYFKKKYKGVWVSIIADQFTNGTPDVEVFLSYGYYLKSLSKFKLHLNGATPHFKESNIIKSSKKILIFSGTLDKWTGIDSFIDDFMKINDDEFELHIYGKGNIKDFKSRLDKNIIFHGFVSEKELEDACREAYAFVNPRPTNISGIENNFPSKILFYLSFGKPIISSKTEGISPVFDNLLYYYTPTDINDLRRILFVLKSLNNEDDLHEIYCRCKEFCKENTWKKQAELLLDYVIMCNKKDDEREIKEN